MNMNQVGTTVHFIGIGGVSMSPLAQVLHHRGLTVTGSDGQDSSATEHLRSLGIPVVVGHKAEHLGSPDYVIRTAAVHDDNPEVAEAHRRNIPVYQRAEGWGAIMAEYENALCIAGTHGKTTTTAMCSQIFLEAEKDPTIMLGGVLPRLGAGHHIGTGDTIILESCEYCNSFHHFQPTVAVILNIEEDHLDFFKDLEEVKASFRTFAEKVPQNGLLLVCEDDDCALDTVKDLPHLSYGISQGDIHTTDLEWENGFPRFQLVYQGKPQGTLQLQVPGEHNLRNALAAASVALHLGIATEHIVSALESFTGAGRRFQHKGEIHGATIVDDYAHHPTELQALLSGVKKLPYQRVLLAFQPHTYTRTKAFFHEFAQVLSQADQVFLLDIYAAREPDTGEISSQMLAQHIPHCQLTGNHQATVEALREMAAPGDLILTVGAGDVYLVGEALAKG